MKNKRLIYKALGIVTLLAAISPFFFGHWIVGLFDLGALAALLVLNIVTSNQRHGGNISIWFPFWFVAPVKRIVHAELGEFLIHDFLTNDKRVGIFRQGIFVCECVASTTIYVPSPDAIANSIKGELDRQYRDELDKKRKEKEYEDALKSFDGYLDPVSRREDKLGNIGI